VPEVVHAGADGVAVISAIVGSGRITAACREFVIEIRKSAAEERR